MSDRDNVPGSSTSPYRSSIPPRRTSTRRPPPPVRPRTSRAPPVDEVKRPEGTRSEPTSRRTSRARDSQLSNNEPDESDLTEKRTSSAKPPPKDRNSSKILKFLRGKTSEPEETNTDDVNRSPRQQPAVRRRTTVSEERTKSSRIMYTTDEEVRDALVEFAVFIIFLVLTSLVTLSVRHSYMFYFNDTIKKLFSTREMVVKPSVTISFEKLITIVDFWDFLIYNFLVTLHGDMTSIDESGEHYHDDDDNHHDHHDEHNTTLANTTTAAPLTKPPEEPPKQTKTGKVRKKRHKTNHSEEDVGPRNKTHLEGRVFLHENLMLGPPRLRQVRVRKDTCYVNDAFIRYFNTCYAAYSSGAEDIRSSHGGAPYRTMSSLEATPLWTKLNTYRTGGYTVHLTFNLKQNMDKILNLKRQHWLDRGSRLVLIEFNLYNSNTDILQSIKLIAEIPPTGGILTQSHLQTVKQFSFFTDKSLTMSVIYIFWYIMVVYYNIYEIDGIRKSGFKNYFRSVINILDSIILLFCYFALCYNIWHTIELKRIINKARVDEAYQSLDTLCFWNMIYVDMMAILAFIVWIKIFKFISFNKTLVQFTTTLRRCSKDLAGFSLMFGIVFLAYAQLGLLLFGTKHPDFRDFVTSILTMIRMILGDFQYNLIEEANRVLGPIYFLTYILLVFFILLNMFLAIIMETYNSVKSEITQGRSQLGSYIVKKIRAFINLISRCGRKRRGNQQQQQRQRRRPEAESTFEVDDANPENNFQPANVQLRRNMTEAEAHFFEDVPEDVRNKDMFRLNNRVALLEEILEQLVTNMDGILKRVEREIKKNQ